VQTVLERLRAEEDEVGPVPAGPGRDQLEQLLLALMRLGEKTG
jgi:hypothetical protein